MKHSKKQKAEIIIQDYYNTCAAKNLFAKSIRLTMRLSQQAVANKGHYNVVYISNFENDVPLRPDVIYDIYQVYEKLLYSVYAELDEYYYILFCMRILCNYAYEVYDKKIDSWDEDLKGSLNKLIALL